MASIKPTLPEDILLDNSNSSNQAMSLNQIVLKSLFEQVAHTGDMVLEGYDTMQIDDSNNQENDSKLKCHS